VRAASALKALLKDPDYEVRKKAAWALGMLLMQRAESFAGDSDSDKDDEASDDAVRGLGGVSGIVASPRFGEKTRNKSKQK